MCFMYDYRNVQKLMTNIIGEVNANSTCTSVATVQGGYTQ